MNVFEANPTLNENNINQFSQKINTVKSHQTDHGQQVKELNALDFMLAKNNQHQNDAVRSNVILHVIKHS